MIKVPATEAGIPAIEELTARGVNVNITLLFSLARYEQVIDAYLRGLERRLSAGDPLETIASVASFFVSRVDTEVDKRLDAVAATGDAALKDRAVALKGRAAVANAQLAYNTKMVDPKEFKSYWDFVNPKWKGKMEARDIRAPGTGGSESSGSPKRSMYSRCLRARPAA